MAVDLSTLARPVGPLPLWGWGALAAGGAILLMARRGHPAAAALVDPGVPVPAAPGATDAAVQPLPPLGIPAGGTAYDPNTGQTTPPVTITDLLGGQSLGDFIGKLGPDYQSFTLQDGPLGTAVTHSAQNQVDAGNYQAGLNADVARQLSANQLTLGQLQSNTDLLAIGAANYYGGDYTGATGVHYRNAIPADAIDAANYYGGLYASGDTSYRSGFTPFGVSPHYVFGAAH